MFLSRILITDFKNIAEADLEFSSGLNCISGANGSGKTNLLDAVYSLSMAKSFFNFQDSFSIRDGKESAAVADSLASFADYLKDQTLALNVSLGKDFGGRKVEWEDDAEIEIKVEKIVG